MILFKKQQILHFKWNEKVKKKNQWLQRVEAMPYLLWEEEKLKLNYNYEYDTYITWTIYINDINIAT